MDFPVYISKEELTESIKNELSAYDGVEGIGLTARTVERDIYEIRNSPYMDVSIEYSRERNGYYIPQNEKSLSKLDRLFELSSLLSFSELKDIVFVEHRKSRGLEHRHALINAIRKTTEIVVEYRKYNHSSSKEVRRLYPYALQEFKGRWYLLATDAPTGKPGTSNLKTWGLDRIEKLTVTNRTFRKNTNINLDYEFEHCFGIYRNKELNAGRVVLSFSPISGKYTDSYPLHESQRILVCDDTEFRIELKVKLTRDFITELLSYNAEMRVIEPACLRQSLIDAHRQAICLLEKDEK